MTVAMHTEQNEARATCKIFYFSVNDSKSESPYFPKTNIFIVTVTSSNNKKGFMSSLYTSAVSYVHGSGTRRLKAAVTPARLASQSVQSGCGAGSATQTVLETLQLIGGGEDGGGLLKLCVQFSHLWYTYLHTATPDLERTAGLENSFIQ